MIAELAENSKREGLSSSRLPTFSKDWIDRIRGSADFFALNYYAGRYIGLPNESVDQNNISYEQEIRRPLEWETSTFFPSAPGLLSLLKYFMLKHIL